MDLKNTVLTHLILLLFSCEYVVNEELSGFESWKNQYLSSNICDGKKQTCQIQLTEGKTKANSFNVAKDSTKAAIEIVHLYTHNNPPFFISLNNKCGSSEKLYSDYRSFLNKAIDEIASELPRHWGTHITTYRGIDTDLSEIEEKKIDDLWPVKGFTSTSTDPKVGLTFARKKLLLEITNVHGLFINHFSKYSYEDEVLIKSPSDYTITAILKNEAEIQKKIDNLVNNEKVDYPQIFMQLRMTSQGSSVSTTGSCDFTSDGVTVLPSYGVLILVLIAAFF